MLKVNHTDKEKFNIGDINVDDMESINEKRSVKIYIVGTETHIEMYKKIRETILVFLHAETKQFNLDKSTRQASILTIKIMSNDMFRVLMNRMGVIEIIIMPYYALEDNGFWKCCYSIVDNEFVLDLEENECSISSILLKKDLKLLKDKETFDRMIKNSIIIGHRPLQMHNHHYLQTPVIPSTIEKQN